MLSYDIVDVFTPTAFAGNPLAVVHGGHDLTDQQMAAMAVEFNLSETAFPIPADATDADYAVRIFTPGGEIPFAGHPSIGTAWVLRRAGRIGTGHVVQQCAAGLVDLDVADEDQPVELGAVPRDLSGPIDAAPVAAAVGLSVDDVVGDAVVAGCGLSFVHLPVTAEALARSHPMAAGTSVSPAVTGQLADPVGGTNVHAVEGSGDDLSVHSRVFCPEVAIPEDPATGSAALGLGIALVATGRLPSGGGSYTITQGEQMGRTSRLYGRVEASDGVASRCFVAGTVVPVATGNIAVPPR